MPCTLFSPVIPLESAYQNFGDKGGKVKRKKKAEITWPIASGAGLYREGRCVFVLLRVSAFFLSLTLVIKDGQHKQQFEI